MYSIMDCSLWIFESEVVNCVRRLVVDRQISRHSNQDVLEKIGKEKNKNSQGHDSETGEQTTQFPENADLCQVSA